MIHCTCNHPVNHFQLESWNLLDKASKTHYYNMYQLDIENMLVHQHWKTDLLHN